MSRKDTTGRQPHDFTRRRLLEAMGVGGLTMALPPLEAFGQTSPKKLIIFQHGNGAPIDLWNNMSIPREGLGDMMGKCTVLRGVSLRQLMAPLQAEGVNGHLAGHITMLTARPATPDPGDTSEIGRFYKATGESCDEAAARIINGGRPVRYWSAEKPLSVKGASYTATGPRSPLTWTWDMVKAFDNIGGVPTDAAVAARRGRVMNGLKRQADVIKKRLGTEDRIRMDQYLTSISQVEMSLTAADRPAATTSANGCVKPVLKAYTLPSTNISLTHVNNVFELGFRALQCDVTNVLVMQAVVAGSGPTLTSMGITGGVDVIRDHEPSHHKGNTTNWKDLFRQSTLWKTKRFAEFLRKLDSEKGPDGKTVLDNAAVLYVSEMGEGGDHSPDNVVTIVAGGAFKKPAGDVIDVNVPMANVLLTAMRAAGISATQMPKWGNSTGTISALV